MMKNTLTAGLLASLITSLALATPTAFAMTSILNETDVEAVALKVANETVKGGYQLVTMAEVKEMIDAREDFVLLDAHPKWEYDMAYVDGAVNFGFQSNYVGTWEEDVTDGSPTQDDLREVLGPDLDKKIVIYCGFTKCGRSHNAALWVKELGYTNVLRAPGGITAWRDLGLPYKVVPNDANTYPNK